MDLNQFLKWQKEKPNRKVDIEIGGVSEPNKVEVWVYDYSLGCGQFVKSVKQIDIEKEKADDDFKKYEALKKRFEGEEDA